MNPLAICEKLGIKTSGHTDFLEYVKDWEQVAAAAKALKDYEMKMRKAIASTGFPAPAEGTNTLDLADGRTLVLTHKIDRKIDETQIALARSEYALINDRPVEFDDLLKVKHELVISAFRKVDLETPAGLTVSRMLIAKAGSPTLATR